MHFLPKQLILAAALTTFSLPSLFAQATTYNQRHDINNRRANEQSRIHQGDASGQITRRGAANLEAHQKAIHSQEHADRAADGGHLTAQDRHQLARKQDRQSARIYRDKHNAIARPGVVPK
jgi:hypothetical protein